MVVEDVLKRETEIWLKNLIESYKNFIPTGKVPKKDLEPIKENIEAYMKDSSYFLGKGDFVKAFEAVVFAWGLLEACQHLGVIKK